MDGWEANPQTDRQKDSLTISISIYSPKSVSSRLVRSFFPILLCISASLYLSLPILRKQKLTSLEKSSQLKKQQDKKKPAISHNHTRPSPSYSHQQPQKRGFPQRPPHWPKVRQLLHEPYQSPVAMHNTTPKILPKSKTTTGFGGQTEKSPAPGENSSIK